MLNVLSYIHPVRTYLPCTGVGRHINNIVLGLHLKEDIDLNLLCSQQYLQKDGRLDIRSPLRDIPLVTFPTPENYTERNWKLFGFPSIDKYIPDATDWLYAPVETYLPVSKCPVAVTIHDIQAFETDLPWSNTLDHKLFGYKWAWWVKRALSDCRVVFTVSEFSKQRMVDLLGADPRKLVVSGNGVDRAFFDIALVDPRSLPRPTTEPYIFSLGGLRSKKGADYILKVASQLLKLRSEFKIVVAGDSELVYVNSVKDFPNIILLGMVPDEDLPALMRGASSLLFLSLYEGFGIPALEAMAAGIPTVVADRASLPEIVGTAGIVVAPEDTAVIVDTLIQLQENLQLREYYIQRGWEHSQQYTWSRCVDIVQKTLYEYA
jgi:glycosyltransferase involved in cell wall biosynthesis